MVGIGVGGRERRRGRSHHRGLQIGHDQINRKSMERIFNKEERSKSSLGGVKSRSGLEKKRAEYAEARSVSNRVAMWTRR